MEIEMNTQSEALRLANELEIFSGAFDAAAELRRLYEANQVMLEALKLAEKSLVSFVSDISDHGWSQSDMDNLDTVTAAIAKGEQQ